MLETEQIILISSVFLMLSVFSSKASSKLNIPALLLFLIIGMLAGSDGPGGIYFNDAGLAQFLGIIALIFILFSSGLSSKWKRTKAIIWEGISLSTVGVVFSAVLICILSKNLLGFTLFEGLLLGAIISPTDPAAVFSLIKEKKLAINHKLLSLVELESGINDPMAVFMTIALTSLVTNRLSGYAEFIGFFFSQFVIGTAMGLCMGMLAVSILNSINLEYEGLYPVLSISFVLFTYGITTFFHGSGFLAVYILGIMLSKSIIQNKIEIMNFHDGLIWLMQIIMFFTLGLLVYPSHLVHVMDKGILASIFLALIARPISVFASLIFTKLSFKEKILISWLGLRGAVPIILATFPLLAHVPKSEMIFNVVFFVVLISMVVQGTTIPALAKALKLNNS
jgi:cell volume regulation protein A